MAGVPLMAASTSESLASSSAPFAGPPIAALVREHIDLLTGIGPNARAPYGRYLRHHIGPLLGAGPVSSIGYREVAGFIRGLSAKGLSPKTIANIHGLLSASMTTAVRLGYRPDNPCVGVSLPKSQLTHDEFALLLSKVAPFYQPLVLTLVATGLRFGEATALTAGDVDVSMRPASIGVTKAWKRDEDSRYYVGRRRRSGLVGPSRCPTSSSTCCCRCSRPRRLTTCCSPTRRGSGCRPRASGRRRGRRRWTRPAARCAPTARRIRTPRG